MKKKLYRNTKEKMITGVCAGFSDYFGHDVVLWRIGTVVITFLTSGGFAVAYIVAAFMIPEKPEDEQFVYEHTEK